MRVLRPFTTHLFNPVARRFAGHLPGFGLLTYRGRRSGRTYRTPINVFRRRDRYVFALTYGADVDWVRNILAAGGCEIRILGQDHVLVDPVVITDPALPLLPLPVRLFGRLMRVTEMLQMRRVDPRRIAASEASTSG
jgi:deazaflavin-dependent oxidoreductase (nitroreductase family)